ncbi:MAG: helix-turn-helix transcriptional regulator [Pseudomonadota bacterium]|nr:helix-turn-helix transcriptional regulator [Pseudomonadota bacterium]
MLKSTEINKIIADKLKKLREKHNISRRRLEELTGVYERKIARYEQNASKIPASFLVLFCQGLGISPSILINEIATDKVYSPEQLELLDILKDEDLSGVVNFLKKR